MRKVDDLRGLVQKERKLEEFLLFFWREVGIKMEKTVFLNSFRIFLGKGESGLSLSMRFEKKMIFSGRKSVQVELKSERKV